MSLGLLALLASVSASADSEFDASGADACRKISATCGDRSSCPSRCGDMIERQCRNGSISNYYTSCTRYSNGTLVRYEAADCCAGRSAESEY